MSHPFSSDWWSPGRVVLAVFGGAFVLDSFRAVWGERRPVGGFFEEMIARVGHYGIVLGSFGLAAYGGVRVTEKFESKWLGFAAGLLLFFALGVGGTLLIGKIPGVDWRYERLMDSMESDY